MYNSLKLGSTSGPGRNVDRVCVLVEVDLVQQSETCLYNYTDSITVELQTKTKTSVQHIAFYVRILMSRGDEVYLLE